MRILTERKHPVGKTEEDQRKTELNANEWLHSIDLKVVLPRLLSKSFYLLPETITGSNFHAGKTEKMRLSAAKMPLCCILWTLCLHHYDIKCRIEEKQLACHHVLTLVPYIKRHKPVFVTWLRCRLHMKHHFVLMSTFTSNRGFNKSDLVHRPSEKFWQICIK